MKIVFASPQLKAIQARIKQVAGTDSTVLITGESGSGKEVIARMIHDQSKRRKSPFVAVNCASFPGSLLEVELFGYEKGAFTGANQRHRGLFEQAHGGTLLLDEIAELDLSLQAKFLRALQEQCFRRVGGESEITVDVRLLASTHRNLKKLVEEGKFREDLFYRISVFPVEVPPLRERPEDILGLCVQYIEYFNREMGKRVEGVTEETKDILLNYAWPGNVRELRNTIERVMIIRDDGRIHPEELPIEIITGVERLPAELAPAEIKHISPPTIINTGQGPGAAPESAASPESPTSSPDPVEVKDLDAQVARFEKVRIEAALKLAEGNQSEAARLLCIRRDTLRFRMKKHRLL